MKNNSPVEEVQHRELPKWVKFSMSNHSEEELRYAILNKPDLVCFTYICRYCQMSGEFIENELIVLSTGIFSGRPDLYTENNKNLVSEIMYIEPTIARVEYQKNLKRNTSEFTKKADKEFIEICRQWKGPIRSKVDWWQIACYQDHLTKSFRIKYAQKFKEAKARVDRPDGHIKQTDLD